MADKINNIAGGELLNMYSLSETAPKMPWKMISREQLIDYVEDLFDENHFICLSGKAGYGITTILALFAHKHHSDCVTYFNNGWSRHLLNPLIIERSLKKQLSLYVDNRHMLDDDDSMLASSIYKISRTTKKRRSPIYIVFDGFDNIPIEYIDSIRQVIIPLFGIDNVRFLFSGTKDNILKIVPEGITLKEVTPVLKFQPNDVKDYLKNLIPNLTEEDAETIFTLTDKGVAERLAILTEKYKEDEDLTKILAYFRDDERDFYQEDLNWIRGKEQKAYAMFLGLLTFSEVPQTKEAIKQILNITEEEFFDYCNSCLKYIKVQDAAIEIRSSNFRKYLRKKLNPLKTEIELMQIKYYENSSNMDDKFQYLPALYKHVNETYALVEYLTSENVQRYLEKKKSQASLNEQCEYGYNACTNFETQMASYFRFAINRSASREIEKNELSDYEIESLIAIGEDKEAFALTQNVFLMEERLKCLLIIAKNGHHLTEAMKTEIKVQIDILIKSIDFEHIPDKAIELAKLMLPFDLVKALEIIDRVAKVTKDKQQLDKLYTAISISYNEESKSSEGDATKADIASTKIVDDGLRKMASVMKSILADSTAIEVIEKMKEMPTAQNQLYFLRFWIPEHKNSADIGYVVKYAVKLVIDTSNTTMPKVSFLRQFCIPLPMMEKVVTRQIVDMLDAIIETIKYPTIEYTKLQILVITAVGKYDKDKAKERLENLYLEIIELKDRALQAHCKSLLLRDFEVLGNKKDVEAWLMTSYQLQQEIIDDIINVLSTSAYHMKVVEGPIKALVSCCPSFINTIIGKINTKERQDRCYLLAVVTYVRQKDIKELDWNYLKKLFYNVKFDKDELYQPLFVLIGKIVDVKDKDNQFLQKVKSNYTVFKKIEQADAQCYVFSLLYVWLCQNYNDIEFQRQVKIDLDASWNKISVGWIKTETGYEISKLLSNISMKTEAKEYERKTSELRKSQILSSTSCVATYTECMSIYVHSLGILIRSNLWEEKDLDAFKNLLTYEDSVGEAMIAWSRIALEFYTMNNIDKFNAIVNQYVSKELNTFSVFYQKRVLYNISPALFLSAPSLLLERLKEFDTAFFNACVENIARFIQTKYPYPKFSSTKRVESQVLLKSSDYENLLILLENTNDDNFIFVYTEIITRHLKGYSNENLSREYKKAQLNKLEEIVKRRLPMPNGIQHNGYKIACLAMITECREGKNIDIPNLKRDIEAIPNTSDQAFLYAHIAGYANRKSERAELLDLAIQKTKQLENTIDKLNRFDMCLQESFDVAKTKSRAMATDIMKSLISDKNGSYSDYQQLIDMVRDHDVDLAESMLEMVDDDPARLLYKRKLKSRIASHKRLEEAKDNLKMLSKLNTDEQTRFFDLQMEYIVKNKSVARDVKDTEAVIKKIFETPITDVRSGVLFFMENLCSKNKANQKYKHLIREIHTAVLYNLKLVLAIASGTKEKLDRVNRILDEKEQLQSSSFIMTGEKAKGIELIHSWYKENSFAILRIIDSYFHPEDLYVIKSLMDINDKLRCQILTCNVSDRTLEESFQSGWNKISATLPGRIEVWSCCFKDQPEKSPIHDRWWLLIDNENNKNKGKRMASTSTFGSRITEISDMDENSILNAINLWNRFVVNQVPRAENRLLNYEEAKLT